jgi:hypothetical protein
VQNVSRFLYEFSLPGVTLVIAHPERQRDFIRDPGALELLVKRGAIAQLTAGSFLGDFGDLPRKAAFEFVERGLVHLVASDAHSLLSRPPRLAAAREFFEGRWGREVAAGIFEKNPEAVLKGKPVSFRLPGGGSEVEPRKVFNSRYCLTWPANQKVGEKKAQVERNEERHDAQVEKNEQGHDSDSAGLPGMVAAVAALLTEDSPTSSSGPVVEAPPFSPALPSRAATTMSTRRVPLSPKQRKFYQRALAVSRREIGEVQIQMHDEVAKAKDRVRELQRAQKAAKLMYDAGCMRLGIPNNLKGSEPQN